MKNSLTVREMKNIISATISDVTGEIPSLQTVLEIDGLACHAASVIGRAPKGDDEKRITALIAVAKMLAARDTVNAARNNIFGATAFPGSSHIARHWKEIETRANATLETARENWIAASKWMPLNYKKAALNP